MIYLQTFLVILATLVAVLGARRFVARFLADSIMAHMVLMGVRLLFALVIAIAVALGSNEHKLVLIFAVGAAYFAAILVDASRSFRRSEGKV